MKKLAILTVLSLTFSQLVLSRTTFANLDDVGSTGRKFIRVQINNEKVRFELVSKDPKIVPQLIGGRDYSQTELESLQTKLNWQLGASSVGSILGVACVAVGAAAGGSAIAGAGLFSSAVDLAGLGFGVTLIGGSAAGVTFGVLSDYNPYALYKKKHSVRDEVIHDKPVFIEGGDKAIDELAESLQSALAQIE